MEIGGDELLRFIIESNKIEGISSDVPIIFLSDCDDFLSLPQLSVDDVVSFAKLNRMFSGAEISLRDKDGLDVRVGGYIPPSGGVHMATALLEILEKANSADEPYFVHQDFEILHPFTDGNGRTGRMIWAWQMVNQRGYDLSIGFLHMWYYQSLQHSRG